MRRDITFLVSGIPKQYRVFDAHFFMADIGVAELSQLKAIPAKYPAFHDFLNKARIGGITIVGFRNECVQESEAVSLAYAQLQGIIDGLTLVTEEASVEIALYVLIRDDDSVDVKVKAYRQTGWARFKPKNAEVEAEWLKSRDALFISLMEFFDIATRGGHEYRSELGCQLLYSMKMYRYGAIAGDFGIEFLCKFSALEGLVCGGSRKSKRALLCARLVSLFRSSNLDIKTLVADLWSKRCEVSHEAKAFDVPGVPDPQVLGIDIQDIDFLFTGCVVFACESVKTNATLESLWATVFQYQLPSHGSQRRSDEMPKAAVTHMLLDENLVWKGVGNFSDQCFKKQAKQTPGQV